MSTTMLLSLTRRCVQSVLAKQLTQPARRALATCTPFILSQHMQQRSYSSQKETLTVAQIEKKVLDIIKNFDRVKENPNKPEVNMRAVK